MSKAVWPALPDDLSFDAFYDEDQILDFINKLEVNARRIFFDALDKSQGEDVIVCSRTGLPPVYIVLMKFADEKEGGLILLLSRNDSNIYSWFERLKEQSPDKVQDIDRYMNIVFEQIRSNEELINKK